MKKTTKSLNSPGSSYFENAAKQIPWDVNVSEKYISVPSANWDQAKENLMVQHMMTNGFFLQDCIPYETKPVFDPKIRLSGAKPLPKELVNDEFAPGTKFRLRSDGTRFEVESSGKTGITVKYPDGQKLPFKTTREIIKRNLSLGVWIRI